MDINGKKLVNIPHAVSYLLDNDEKQDEAISDLDERIRQALVGVFHYKGSVATYADLPVADNQVGDVYNVLETGANYAWDGTAWDDLSGIVDLSDYVTIDGNETITGVKTFSNGILSNSFKQISGALEIGVSGNDITMGGDTRPNVNAYRKLGAIDRKWRDIFLSHAINPNAADYGLTFPDTSGFTADKEIGLAEGTSNVINVSEMTDSSHFSQAQLNLIKESKITIINGTFLNLGNRVKILSAYSTGSYIYALLSFATSSYQGITYALITESNGYCNARNNFIRFGTNSIYISTDDGTNNNIYLNGLKLPTNPPSTGTLVLKCINGVLDWVQE